MKADVIAGVPLETLILDLASDDMARRGDAGVRLFLFLHGISDLSEYERRDSSADAQAWPWPKPECHEALDQAVAAVFKKKDFPVIETVTALAYYAVECESVSPEGLQPENQDGPDPLDDSYRGYARAAVVSVLGAIGPGASESLPVLIDMLRIRGESDGESSCANTWLAARAIASMGSQGAPAFDALFDCCCSGADDPVLEALRRIVSESPEAAAKAKAEAKSADENRRGAALAVLEGLTE